MQALITLLVGENRPYILSKHRGWGLGSASRRCRLCHSLLRRKSWTAGQEDVHAPSYVVVGTRLGST